MDKKVMVILGIILGVAALILIRNFMGNQAQQDRIIVLGMKSDNYYPDTIDLEYGKPVTLRNDGTLTNCAQFLKLPELGIAANFDSEKDYTFTPTKRGTFIGMCTSNFYRLTVNVR
ncbi:MAG: hypothetical protein ABIJ34_04590 [archaeon]